MQKDIAKLNIHMNKKEKMMMYKSFFLNEGAINYIKRKNKSDLESELNEAKIYCNIPAKDANDLLKQLHNNDFLGIERASTWKFTSIPVLNYTGEVCNFGCCQANFSIVNKWGYKQLYKCFQIIYSNDCFVTWMGNVLTGGPVFWVSVDKRVFRLTYTHKRLMIYPNICSEPELIAGLDQTSLDNVIKKYHKLLRVFDPNFIMLEHETGYKGINLERHFPKGFFYKGPKYNYSEYKKVNYYAWVNPVDVEKKEISEMKGVNTENSLFKIEIENNTYPHSGYAYLDLNKMEVVGDWWNFYRSITS